MEPQLNQAQVAVTRLYRDPSADSAIETEVLFGETVRVLGVEGSWTRVTTVLDNYPGYIETAHLASDLFQPTHRVNEVVVPTYQRPGFKHPFGRELYMNSLVRALDVAETPQGTMVETAFGWFFEDQLKPVDYRAPDFVAELSKFVGCAYDWGARSRGVVDCSAYIQSGCIAAGLPCPRDAKPQSRELGEPIDFAADFSNLVRGDLVFWTEDKGSHVVAMEDSQLCLNASIAAPRRVRRHPLLEAIAEQARDGNGPVTVVRRFPGYRAS